jgi:diacylglycerol kinase (ATP)
MQQYPGTNKALFIINPEAGIPPLKYIITKELERRKNELSFFKSPSIDESGNQIKQNFEKYEIFVAAGGDGTVHTIASELIGKEKLLGVLPIGSGNGFAKELGFKKKITSLLQDIEKNESLPIDVLEINNNLCLNVAGVGLDSFVAHSFNKLKTRGFWTYVGVTLLNFIKLRPVDVTLTIDGKEIINDRVFLLSVANTRQFGNNAYIAPEAVPNDGKMDIVIINRFPKYLAPVFIYRLFTKKLNKSRYVKYIKTDGDVLLRAGDDRFHIDGEPVRIVGEARIRIRTGALQVLRTKHNRL